MTSDVRQSELFLNTTGATLAAGVVHGANVSTEAVRLQQLLAGLGAV